MKWTALMSCLYCISIHKAASLDLKKLRAQILEAAKGGEKKISAPEISQHTRIIGGVQSARGEAPWQGSLRLSLLSHNFHAHICGTVIISDYWLVSAAHCLNITWELDVPPELKVVMTVAAGEYDRRVKDPYEQMRRVQKIYIHPGYDQTGNLENDIGLILTDEPIVFGRYVYSVLLPSPEQTFSTEACTVSGWGLTDANDMDSMSSVLQKTTVNVISDKLCAESCTMFNCNIFESMICAGVSAGGKDACQGDSGGGLTCQGLDGYLYLAGIVSGGYGCALPGLYGIYTEISYYRQWIDSTIAEDMAKITQDKSTTEPTTESTTKSTTPSTTQTPTTLFENGTIDSGLLDPGPKKLTLATTTADPSEASKTASKCVYILLLSSFYFAVV